MKKGIMFYFLIFVSLSIYGQNITIDSNNDKKYNSVTTSFSGGRFEFIMSDLVVRHSFKIDKYTGDVYMLVKRDDDSFTWDLLLRDPSDNDKQFDNKINYQLYMSGIAVRFCYLLNTNTGITWQLVKSKDDTLFFELIQ